ncbi:MAG TPA: pyridoxal phosphate-dependent aminotransferase [Bdellovibrionota bacterium]|nr:pyridoxal phosphate-dependent aminotransferase [Bdellovibrionota bacterium]
MKLSQRVERLRPSPTLALNQRAKALKAEGKSIVNLTIGEPDFPTPDRICSAAVKAIARRETRYTPTGGIPELKKAIAKTVSREYGRQYEASESIVSVGAKQSLFNLCCALLDEGSEAVVVAPYWVSYVDMVELAGGTARVLRTDEKEHFAPRISAMEQLINKRTRILFLNSPSNPTGVTYSRALLEDIVRLAKKWPDLAVVTDDIYGQLVFDGKAFVSIGMIPELPKEQLVIVSGVSKTYAMTGWRIGYALGDKKLISALENVQSQSTSGASSIAQWAALEAISGEQADVGQMKEEFEHRRNHIYERLCSIPDVTCEKPDGAFYFFPNIAKYLNSESIDSDDKLAAYLLDKYGLAVVPGSDFGSPGFLRLSFSASITELDEGLARFEKGLGSVRK